MVHEPLAELIAVDPVSGNATYFNASSEIVTLVNKGIIPSLHKLVLYDADKKQLGSIVEQGNSGHLFISGEPGSMSTQVGVYELVDSRYHVTPINAKKRLTTDDNHNLEINRKMCHDEKQEIHPLDYLLNQL